MASGIEAGKAYIKFLLEDKEFKKSLNNIGSRLQSVGKIGMAAVTPIIAGFAGATAAALNFGDGIGDMAARTGIAADKLSALQYAADQSDVAVGTLERGIQRMTLNIGNAVNGTGTFSQTLGQLGVSLNELRAMSPDQQFLRISDAIAKVEDPSLRAALAQKTFGKASQELGPLLATGKDGIEAAMMAAERFGVVITEQDVVALGALDQALKTMKTQMFGASVQIGAAVAGPMADFLGVLAPINSRIITLIKNNPQFVRTIGAITVAVGAAATATYGLGIAIKFATAHPIIAALSVIAGAVAAIAAYFWDAADGTAALGNSIDNLPAGKTGGANVMSVEEIQMQANAMAAQAQAGMAVATVPAIPTTVDPALQQYASETANGIMDLLKLSRDHFRWVERQARSGGFVAGVE